MPACEYGLISGSMKILITSFFFLAILSVFVSAQSLPEQQDRYVNDFAGFLDASSVFQLRGLLSETEENTTAEVVVVTIPAAEPLPPSQYRTELFNKWKIGKAEKDNGLLILYAAKEKRIEAEVGYGLEGILPDSKVGRILDDFYVPYRDSNQTAAGIVEATKEFARVINGNADEVRAGETRGSPVQEEILFYLMGLLPFAILAAVFLLISLGTRPPKCHICGERMELYESGREYETFKCGNGHLLRRRRHRYDKLFIAGGLGGLGRGGSGGGFGGGFGGGGSGGGGAGR